MPEDKFENLDADQMADILSLGKENPDGKLNSSSDSEIPQIEGYSIIKKIGEGGMGIVYLAEQHPIKRKVAIKAIKKGMDSKKVLKRFELERQTLALLNHSCIAQIFDTGMTNEGRSYFVMEYVEGEPITDFCDKYKLSIENRLKLFLQVCDAIQYAHQKGVIHRDIKPSNILVAKDGNKVILKVIDFGIAKAVKQDGGDSMLITQQGQLVGTPAYMSPEQAGKMEEDIDKRTDIYSLGVLLYELLTGTQPFDRKRLRKAALYEILKVIQEEEPPRPSTRLSSLGDIALEMAQKRRTEVASLVRLLHDELEWIPIKAMYKDRDQRYHDASDMAVDIQNYLKGKPLLAGPETNLYKIKNFLKRNKIVLMGNLAVLLILALVILFAVKFNNAPSKGEEPEIGSIAAINNKENLRKMVFVSALARGDNSGANWDDAFIDLQDALKDADSNCEVWVTQGVYKPDRRTKDRSETFLIPSGVEIYGGFSGNETRRDQRDFIKYETILSGDLLSNDASDFMNFEDNSIHVVTTDGVDQSTILDGLTITAGCAKEEEYPDESGGGMFIRDESGLNIVNCIFRSNIARHGGALRIGRSSFPVVKNCMFISNDATYGGAIYGVNSNPTVIGCSFYGNKASNGGAVFNNNNMDTLIINCVFSNNNSNSGGAFWGQLSKVTMINSTFSMNKSSGGGGALRCKSMTTTIANCILWKNTANTNGSQIELTDGMITISNCNIQGGQTGIYREGVTLYWKDGNLNVDPSFFDPDGRDDIFGTIDDDYTLMYDSHCINTGDNEAIPEDVTDMDEDGNTDEKLPTDLKGKPRVLDGTVDMGAFEK